MFLPQSGGDAGTAAPDRPSSAPSLAARGSLRGRNKMEADTKRLFQKRQNLNRQNLNWQGLNWQNLDWQDLNWLES